MIKKEEDHSIALHESEDNSVTRCEGCACNAKEGGCGIKRAYILAGLNCPNCSAKIEREVGEVDGVRSSNVNLIKQTLTIEIDDEVAATIDEKVEEIVHKHEPDVSVNLRSEAENRTQVGKKVENGDKKGKMDEEKLMIVRLIVGAVIYGVGLAVTHFANVPLGVALALYIVPYVILGVDVLLRAVQNIVKGRIFDENFLMSLSTVGAFVIGEYPEAVAVMLFYQIGEFFQDLAVRRSRKSISELMDIRPDKANVLRGGEVVKVSPEQVCVGEIISVRPGEKIPLDGSIVRGSSTLDTKALTGESVPRSVGEGDEALSGCINLSGALEIRVSKEYGQSTVAKIIDLVENASSQKAPAENFITGFARYYTPVVVILAALLAVLPPLCFGGQWVDWIHRGFVFLVISCPCALVISIPLTFFGGIGAASRRGVLVKGGNYLEALEKADTIVFDKTGTVTKGVFNVAEVMPANGFESSDVIRYAAMAESFSLHPIARSILGAYKGEIDEDKLSDRKELSGKGVSVCVNGKRILAGNTKLMESEKIDYVPCTKVGTKVYVAIDGIFAGCILISDELKPTSKTAIAELKMLGIKKTVMLTGDDEKIAESVANELGIDEYHAGLLPAQKVEFFDKLAKTSKKAAFVGDGINDAPVLARADIGIAMGGLGSDAAIEAADVVLMTDEPSGIGKAIKVAKATKRIVIENIVFALGVKVVFLTLGALGLAGMWLAVFGDVGVAMLAILNAMRMLKK